MYRTLSSLVVLFVTAPLYAQSPVGYAEPDSTRPLIDYRLPDWSYRTLTLDASGRANGSTVTNASTGDDRKQWQARASLRPSFYTLYESEARTADLRIFPQIDYAYRTNETTGPTGLPEEWTREELHTSTLIDGALRTYGRANRFLLTRVRGEVAYLSRTRHPAPDFEFQGGTSYVVEGRAGIGLGRVRDVTPVVRALRLDARLNALGRGARLSDEEVLDAARQFARRPGYRAIFDRPNKYFWEDLFDGIDDRTGPLSPFELLYLTDVLKEQVGIRREGAEVAVGGLAGVLKDDDIPFSFPPIFLPSASSNTYVGAFASGRWFHNPSLNHQLGLVADAIATTAATERNTGTLRGELTGSWLWSVADRFLLDSQLSADLIRFDGLSDTQGRYLAASDLLYFVENDIALRVGGRASWQRSNTASSFDQDRFMWNVTVGLSYYLDRTLR